MCTGYDLIKKEDISGLERGMKGVFAAVDVVKGARGVKTSGSSFGDMNPADTTQYNKHKSVYDNLRLHNGGGIKETDI